MNADSYETLAAGFPGVDPRALLVAFYRAVRSVPPSRWASVAFVIDGAVRVEERNACAAWLRRNDLRDAASRVKRRPVAPGRVLVVVISETEPPGVLVGPPPAEIFEQHGPAVLAPVALPLVPRRVRYVAKGAT